MPYIIEYKGPGWYLVGVILTRLDDKNQTTAEVVYIDHEPVGTETFLSNQGNAIIVAS